MAGGSKGADSKRYWYYSKKFGQLVDTLEEIHKNKGTIELSYLNGTYWCPLLEFETRDCVNENSLSVEMTVRVISHDRTIIDKFQDAKVGLRIGQYTMLADVGEITCKKKKDKSLHYTIELSWS